MSCQVVRLKCGVEIAYRGPDLSAGPMPCFLYFALSMRESLDLDPYNQPVAALDGKSIRSISITLPFHGPNFEKTEAIGNWSKEIAKGHNILEDFFEEVDEVIDELIEEKIASRVIVGGLSRGGFIALHVAARHADVSGVLAFAPMTDLSYSEHFKGIPNHPIVHDLACTGLVDDLYEIPIRIYIGNYDTMVGTDACFRFVFALAQHAHARRVRSPKVEMLIAPSIGHRGHGTAKETFEAGAQWVADALS